MHIHRVGVLVPFVLLMPSPSAIGGAPRFAIELAAETPAGRAAASGPSAPKMPDKRPALTIKAGKPVTIRWKVSSTDSRETIPGVTVHFFCARQGRAGQAEAPGLDRDVCAESAANIDFR